LPDSVCTQAGSHLAALGKSLSAIMSIVIKIVE
jgi:hypothetical protein